MKILLRTWVIAISALSLMVIGPSPFSSAAMSRSSGAVAHAVSHVSGSGTISGLVTDSNGAAISGICVNVYNSSGGFNVTTSSSGNYTISGLAAGTYTVRATGQCGSTPLNFVAQMVSVTVGTGGSATQNFTLATGTIISGTIVDSSGSAIAGVCVNASNSTGGTGATTSSSGTYSIVGLAAGTYNVTATGQCGSTPLNYVAQTVSVTVGAGATVTQNFMMVTGATISGTVTDSSGTAIARLCLQAVSNGGGSGSASSSSTGNYSISGLSAGTYNVTATGQCGSTPLNYVAQTVSVTVGAGATVTQNFTMVTGATISGTVTDSSGTALVNICVSASGGTGWYPSSISSSTGNYSIGGLSAGTYNVTATGQCGSTPLNYVAQTVSVTVGAGATVTQNFTMVTGATITGTVTDSSGTALADICINLFDGSTGSNTSTSLSGGYSVAGLGAGTYDVTATANCGGTTQNFEPQSVSVTVGAGATVTQNFTMVTGATISGTVTDSSGTAISNICVNASGGAGAFLNVTTSSNGAYTITGLASGAYTLSTHSTCGPSQQNFVDQSATIVVTTGGTATYNFVLAAGATISGTVTDASATGISNICVNATNGAGSYGSSTTSSSGAYSIVGLIAGTYNLTTSANCNGSIQDYGPQSVSVTVTTGGTATYNFVLAAGATISGTVTDASATGISNICVNATNGAGSYGSSTTSSSGAYSIVGLAAGTFSVSVSAQCGGSPQNYAPQSATVSVTSGGTATQDFTMVTGGTISGIVTDAKGTAISGACVQVSGASNNEYVTATTSLNGSYSLGGLATGSYEVTANGQCGSPPLNYVQQSVNVNISAGANLVKDFALFTGATISGTVTSTSGSPIANVCVWAHASSTGSGYVNTSASGMYSIVGLAAGTYTVTVTTQCVSPAQNYAPQSVSVTVANAGQATQDFVLASGAIITGTVSNSAGVGLAGFCVNVNGISGNYGSDFTSSNGTYSVIGVPAGSYTLTVSSQCDAFPQDYAPQSVSVAITAGSTITHDFTMATGATISGTVTNSSGQAIVGACVSASNGSIYATVTTTGNGSYVIVGLDTGTFGVSVNASCSSTTPNFAPQSAGVSAVEGATSTQDFSLVIGGTISGTVINSAGVALPDVCVNVEGVAGYGSTASTTSTGAYSIVGLPSGSYYLYTQVNCQSGAVSNYGDIFVSGVGVTSGNSTTQNLTLSSGGSISGTVSDVGTGTPISSAYVQVWVHGTKILLDSAPVLPDGTYTVPNLSTGTYDVSVVAQNYGSADLLGIPVTANSNTSGINFTLGAGGSISGTVSAAGGGGGVGGVCVNVMPIGGSLNLASSSTASDGTYTISGLAPGTYTIEFDGTCSSMGYAHEIPSATVTVTAGATATYNFAIAKTPTAPTISNLPSVPVFGQSFAPSVVTSGDGSTSVTSSTLTSCTVNTSTGIVSFTGIGPCTLVSHVGAGTAYVSSDGLPQTVVVGPAPQSLAFSSSVAGSVPANTTYIPTATSSSGLAVTISIDPSSTSGACSMSAGTITFASAGTCVIDASQSGNVDYQAAATVIQVVQVLASTLSVAPPPTGISPTALGAPSSVVVTSSGGTLDTTFASGSSTLDVPPGALPTGTAVSEYPITNDATLTSQVPSGQSYVLGVAVTWEAPDGSVPTATTPLTMTITDGNIVAGDAIYTLTAAGLVKVGTATVNGSITFTFTTDPIFMVTQRSLLTQSSLHLVSVRGVVGRPLTLSVAGGSGSGALSFSVTNGTAKGCSIDNGALRSSGPGTCLVTATKAADATYLSVTSAATSVAMALPARPGAIVIGMSALQLGLTGHDRAVLSGLAKRLLPGASVVILGYATGNPHLARLRAASAARYLVGLVKVHVRIGTNTRQRQGEVRIVTISQ